MSPEKKNHQEGEVVENDKKVGLSKFKGLASYREGDDIEKIQGEGVDLSESLGGRIENKGDFLLMKQEVLFEELFGGENSSFCVTRKRLSPRVLELRQLSKEEEVEMLRKGRDSIAEDVMILVDDLGLDVDDEEDFIIIGNIVAWAMGDVRERKEEAEVVLKGSGTVEKATKILERMDRREGKGLVTEALRKERVKDEESWKKWYEKRLEKAYTDITLGGKQYSYEEFKSNFEIIIKESGQKFDGLKLMEDGYSELSNDLEKVTRSMWKLHCNGVATFDKRKNFGALLDLRKGERPDGYKWYDLGADDFDNFKKLSSSGQISSAFALYLRMGTTVDLRYSEKPKDPYSWEIMVDGEIYRNPWTLGVPDKEDEKLDHKKGEVLTSKDVKRIREMVVKKSGSVFAENVALSLIYATDLAGAFGARINGGNEWGCASRRLYYPLLELERASSLSEEFKNDLEKWGAMELSFLEMITGKNKVNKKGGVVVGREKEIRLMQFWLDGGFDKVDYVGIGFGGTGAQTSGFFKAAKLFDLMKAEHEGGKILSQDKLREYIDWFEKAVEKGYSKEVRYRLQEDWMWDQMRKWKKDQRGTGPWSMGTVDRGSMKQIIRGAKDVGFLIKKGEDEEIEFDTFTPLFKRFS